METALYIAAGVIVGGGILIEVGYHYYQWRKHKYVDRGHGQLK